MPFGNKFVLVLVILLVAVVLYTMIKEFFVF